MIVRGAEAFLIRLPLRFSVSHALASRQESLNLVVRLRDEAGNEGWGEGVPRDYVTGELPAQALEHLRGVILPGLVGARIESAEHLLPVVAARLSPAPGHQTSCCAAELALFDLAGKRFCRSAAAWFGGRRRETVRYAAVLPLLPPAARSALLAGVKLLGAAHLKVKADGDAWAEALAEARAVLGDAVSIAVDANGSWDLAAAQRQLRRLARFNVAWVEQPLARGRESDLPALAAGSEIPLMADESLTTEDEARALARQGSCRLFNLRVSKLGGLAACHRIARIAAESGVRVQVGCQVGESSLLSAAGRLLATTLPAYEALEGSYGTRLLEGDLTGEPFEFGPGGAAEVQRTPGLGIAVSMQRLAPLVVSSAVVA